MKQNNKCNNLDVRHAREKHVSLESERGVSVIV